MDEYNAAAIILCGIPLDKPFPQHYLTIPVEVEKNNLRKGKLYLEDCSYMMGTVYPTRPFKQSSLQCSDLILRQQSFILSV
jgi:RNA-dependent RNA polymerase